MITRTMMRVWEVLTNKRLVGAKPGERRVFVVCDSCHRTVPVWRCFGSSKTAGCRCGSPFVRPRNIGTLSACYWLFVRGLIVRRWIQRRSDWDPRLALRSQ